MMLEWQVRKSLGREAKSKKFSEDNDEDSDSSKAAITETA